MKEKIANALKTKYANLGLSEKAFNGVASLIEKTVTDESMLETAISESYVLNFLKDLQSEQDKLRGEKSTAVKALEDYKKLHPSTEPEPQPKDEAWKAEIEAIKAKLAASEKQQRTNDIMKEVRQKMKNGGSDNDFILGVTLANVQVGDEDTADSLAAKYKEVYDANYKAAYGNGAVPPKGVQKVEGYKAGDYNAQIEALKREGVIPKSNN